MANFRALWLGRGGVTVGALALTVLVGCQGGERKAYRSDAWSPKTITLLDTRTGESVVTLDVPVGKQLNMWFVKSRTTAEREGTNTLRYAFRPWGDKSTIPGTTFTVPPPSALRLDMTERAKPEMPPAAGGS